MKTRLLVVGLGLAALFTVQGSVAAQEAGGGAEPTYLCTPRLQLRQPGACPAAGPGGRVAELAILGVYPQTPLPTVRLDPNLSYVPWDYLRVGEGGASFFPSPDAAVQSVGATDVLAPGFVFLSYSAVLETGGGVVYATPRGYVRGDQVSGATIPLYRGMAFSRTPSRPFGWIISGGTCTERTPGPPVDYTGRCYMVHEVVQIYAVQRVGEWDWFLIGPDEWVEQRMVARVVPDPTPPEGVDGDRWISVNLYEQTIAVYEGGQLVFATAASTGRRGFWTQPGVFQIWAKLERDDMTGGVPDDNYYFLENVPWVLYFDQARALHGTYWHNRFGAPTSRGCVNLSPADAHWLYDFAGEGTWVYVWDPSGATPTDPAAYGAGGA